MKLKIIQLKEALTVDQFQAILKVVILVDFGVFGAERDAYLASDDTDRSYAGLGFFG